MKPLAERRIAMRASYCFLIAALLPSALRASPQDIISTYAGGGPNNVPATQANIEYPVNTAVDSKGNFYVVVGSQTAGYENRIYKVNASGIITVVAGDGFSGYTGDGGSTTQAELSAPRCCRGRFFG